MNNDLLERVQKKYRILTQQLIKTGIRVSTMESCTSGLIASLITDTEGSSSIMPGAVVAYSNEEKAVFGLEEAFLKTHSVYSPETAAAMAVAIRDRMHTDLGIGITGCFANPDPANPEGIPGTVFYEIILSDKRRYGIIHTGIGISRFDAKLNVAEKVADEITELIKEIAG